ncbi:MAG: peptidylprolyl isomerase, partial [Phocaeicola sp.]
AIDKKVFKQGTYQPDVDYPITLVIGKKMKNGPEDFKDVKEQVTHNFLSEYEEQLLKHLREKYHVERN